ncbi:MAG: hypothetical protein HKN76_14145 [Saprospiraceae bacterium]|nr:hypothetical protein [Saprospiraceae bacterium]
MKGLVLICVSYLCASTLSAAVISWNGSSDSNWFNGGNWNGGIPAGVNDTAIINSGNNDPVILSLTQVTLAQLDVRANAAVTVSSGGILTVQNAPGPVILNQGTLISGGFLQVTSVSGGGIINYAGATIEVVVGGQLSFAEVSGVCFRNLAGANLINNGNVKFNTIEQTFSGTGIISGNGTFEQVSINGSSTFSPGASPGKMTFDGGLMLIDSGGYICEIFSSSSFDTLTGSEISLGGTLTVQLNGYTAALGDAFPIVTCNNCTGYFDSLSLPPTTGDLVWHIGFGSEKVVLSIVAANSAVWSGTTDDDWTTNSNWTDGTIPGITGNAVIATSYNPATIQAGSNVTIGSIEVLPCAVFEVELSATFIAMP